MNWIVFYIKGIQKIQLTVSVFSVVLFLFALPMLLAFSPELFTGNTYTALYTLSLAAATFVMVIRPLADIFEWKWIRSLVILRKGFGILSASIIVGFLLSKIIIHGGGYITGIFSLEYWSFAQYKFFAHIGDVTGVVLLMTSNNLSKQILGVWWKRIQKLAYVYFYAGALYEVLALQSFFAVVAISVVTALVLLAAIKNRLLT